MSILSDPMLQLQADLLEIGRKGEEWVFDRERKKLSGTQYANSVVLSSNGTRTNFDIKSRTIDGEVLFIEVKATDGAPEHSFYMSADEYAFVAHCAEHGVSYELHRVHHVRDDMLRDEVVYTAEEVMKMFEKAPASYILKQKAEEEELLEEIPEFLPWEDCADRIPGTKCRFYLAKIEGAHPAYRFDRRFLRGKYDYEEDKIWLSCEIEKTGVYEVGMKWLDAEGHVLQQKKDWFLLVDGEAFDLEYWDVLNAVDALKQRAA